MCKAQSASKAKTSLAPPLSFPILILFFSLFWFPSFAFFEFDPHPLFRFVSLSSNFCFSFPDNSAISACETAVCCCGIAPVQRSAGDELKLASSSDPIIIQAAEAAAETRRHAREQEHRDACMRVTLNNITSNHHLMLYLMLH